MSVVDMAYTMKSLASDRQVEAREDNPRVTLGDFECEVSGTTVTAFPAKRFETVEEARAELEPYLRDWEAELDLRGLPVRFDFATSHEKADAEEGQAQHHNVTATASVGVSATVSVKATVTLAAPRGEYRATPVVDYLRFRWLSAAKTYNELPTSSAYALLTFLESHFGGRDAVATRLNVSSNVLSAAGRLSARADPLQGRKLKGVSKPLTPEDLGWLNSFIEVVGKRAAYVESGNMPADLLELGKGLPPLT